MKYAYYPGCLAKASAHELYDSTSAIAKKLGIELVELTAASCCGAGVLHEADPFLNVVLNARTFAQAESLGLDILTVCSTCQGVMCQVQRQLEADIELLSKTNEILAQMGLRYEGKVRVRHMLWVLVEDYGLEKLESYVTKPLTGFRIAPFYGCYLLRPPEALMFEDHEKPESLDKLIAALGGETVHYEGETKCCGFPVLFVQQTAALSMTACYLQNAKREDADFVVTPCPLCHTSLDTYQKRAEKTARISLGLPVLHVPQLVGLALGIDHKKLGLLRHMVSVSQVLAKIE